MGVESYITRQFSLLLWWKLFCLTFDFLASALIILYLSWKWSTWWAFSYQSEKAADSVAADCAMLGPQGILKSSTSFFAWGLWACNAAWQCQAANDRLLRSVLKQRWAEACVYAPGPLCSEWAGAQCVLWSHFQMTFSFLSMVTALMMAPLCFPHVS